MDYSFLLALLPHTVVGYASALISVCAALATVVPQKTAVGKVVHAVALNFGQAANAAPAPAVAAAAAPAK